MSAGVQRPEDELTLTEAFSKAAEATQAAEEPAPAEDGPQDADELPCGHAPVWAESGTCMVCDARVGAAGTVATRQKLGDDAGGGRL